MGKSDIREEGVTGIVNQRKKKKGLKHYKEDGY